MSFQQEKQLVLKYFEALESAETDEISNILQQYTAENYELKCVYPFNELTGVTEATERFWQPLFRSFKHLQRRQDIFFAGDNELDESRWVVSMGHYLGLFDEDWLGIPASRKMAMLRYVEFHCVSGDQITNSTIHVDIINLMNQQGIHPLPPQTGASFVYPGPRTHDGLLFDDAAEELASATLEVMNKMVKDLLELNNQEDQRVPPSFLASSWHDDMIWYGPGGIGASYTIPRYQEQHQYPFRENLKNKTFNGHIARLAEGNYAAFFGWPNLTNTATGGFLGLPGNEIKADMRVVDVYRRDGDKLAENWVFIDLPWWLKQQGVDILDRTTTINNPQK